MSASLKPVIYKRFLLGCRFPKIVPRSGINLVLIVIFMIMRGIRKKIINWFINKNGAELGSSAQ